MRHRKAEGFSLIELVASLAVAMLVLAALGGVVGQATRAQAALEDSAELQQQAQFAMDRVLRSVRATSLLLVPNAGDPLTDRLVVALDPTLDRDNDGFADADNDRDGSIDEDPPNGLDDDGDGSIDEDWVDEVVYRLDGAVLLERLPNPHAASVDDYTERPIADSVGAFQLGFVAPTAAGRPAILDVTLTLTSPGGASVTINTQVRAGAGL